MPARVRLGNREDSAGHAQLGAPAAALLARREPERPAVAVDPSLETAEVFELGRLLGCHERSEQAGQAPSWSTMSEGWSQ